MFFQGNEKYNCATYLRLSRSDGDQHESNSIKNQRALLNDYMGKHPELHKFDEYVDDGYSGTNFERPDFKRMMEALKGRDCYGGLDLSSTGDITAFVLMFPPKVPEEKYIIRNGCPAHPLGDRILRYPKKRKHDVLLLWNFGREHQHKSRDVSCAGQVQSSITDQEPLLLS